MAVTMAPAGQNEKTERMPSATSAPAKSATRSLASGERFETKCWRPSSQRPYRMTAASTSQLPRRSQLTFESEPTTDHSRNVRMAYTRKWRPLSDMLASRTTEGIGMCANTNNAGQ